ncbi:hypothetical protein IC582_027601 [Cucumis melo]
MKAKSNLLIGLILLDLVGIHCCRELKLGLIHRSYTLILLFLLVFFHGGPSLKFWRDAPQSS